MCLGDCFVVSECFFFTLQYSHCYSLCSSAHFHSFQYRHTRIRLIKIHAPSTSSPYSKALTCAVSFGHQPCEAATDFGSGEVIVLKRLYCWSNECFLNIPDVLNFTHISPSTVFLNPNEQQRQGNTKASHRWAFA